MTDWLPIETYPLRQWALFRGGVFYTEVTKHTKSENMEIEDKETSAMLDREIIGMAYESVEGCPLRVLIGWALFDHDNSHFNVRLEYHGPTEWLPLEILDMIEPHHVTAARLLL